MNQLNLSALRCFEYARKSSEAEERQAISIESQLAENAKIRESLGLNLVAPPFTEERSAKEPGRPRFNEMMRRIEAGEADAVVCWKLDRLSRNPIDNGQLEWLLGKRVLKAVIPHDRIYTGSSDDKFMSALILAMGTKYIDDLSENVRTKNRAYLSKGYWTGRPYTGYIRDPRYRDDPRFRDILPDPERFNVFRDALLLILSGTTPSDALDVLNNDWKYTTRRMKSYGGKRVSKATFYRLLRDPFYAGLMRRGGATYEGRHQPMITMDQFQQIQNILDGKSHPGGTRPELKFPYRGLLTCGRCGAKVTAKIATNHYGTKYRYYHCCRKNFHFEYCTEPAIQEPRIDEQLGSFIEQLVLPERWLAILTRKLQSLQDGQASAVAAIEERSESRLREIAVQLERLDDLVISEVLSPDVYKRKRGALLAEKASLGNPSAGRLDQPAPVMKLFEDGLSLLRSAPKSLAELPDDEKAVFARQLAFNLKLTDKTVLVSANFPFSILAQAHHCPSMRAWRDWIETLSLRAMTKDFALKRENLGQPVEDNIVCSRINGRG